MSKTLWAEIKFVGLKQKPPADYPANITIQGVNIRSKYSLEAGYGDPGENPSHDSFDYSEFAVSGIYTSSPGTENLTYEVEGPNGTSSTWSYNRFVSFSAPDSFEIPPELAKHSPVKGQIENNNWTFDWNSALKDVRESLISSAISTGISESFKLFAFSEPTGTAVKNAVEAGLVAYSIQDEGANLIEDLIKNFETYPAEQANRKITSYTTSAYGSVSSYLAGQLPGVDSDTVAFISDVYSGLIITVRNIHPGDPTSGNITIGSQAVPLGGGSRIVIGGQKGGPVLGDDSRDILAGGAGADVVLGRGGNDLIIGGSGADYMQGGSGNDVYVVDRSDDTIYEAKNEGIDRVETSVSRFLPNNFENMSLSGGRRIDGTGNAFKNIITGNVSDNNLDGLAGADKLKGGAGHDTFILSTRISSTNIDHFNDFRVSDDQIQLNGDIFKGITNGNIRNIFRDITKSKQDKDDMILYNNKSGILYYDADKLGGKQPVKIAVVDTHAKLTYKDFDIEGPLPKSASKGEHYSSVDYKIIQDGIDFAGKFVEVGKATWVENDTFTFREVAESNNKVVLYDNSRNITATISYTDQNIHLSFNGGAVDYKVLSEFHYTKPHIPEDWLV